MERFSTGDPNFRNSGPDRGFCDPENLFVREYFGMRESGATAKRGAIETIEIATVGYGDAKVVDGSIVRINKFRHSEHFPIYH
jgi:hypothetical protein